MYWQTQYLTEDKRSSPGGFSFDWRGSIAWFGDKMFDSCASRGVNNSILLYPKRIESAHLVGRHNFIRFPSIEHLSGSQNSSATHRKRRCRFRLYLLSLIGFFSSRPDCASYEKEISCNCAAVVPKIAIFNRIAKVA